MEKKIHGGQGKNQYNKEKVQSTENQYSVGYTESNKVPSTENQYLANDTDENQNGTKKLYQPTM